ncbi:MAG: enoyl-CoA hydratase [Bdellovibrionaceae bacterium]|nr:enoyl-CoA hydratase [Pseudobdellovibrionaceae bacterium]|tara:strand:+ start:46328 stop:47122 length:795 start_codon:yes stop_codon:yes gene_type:complete
MEFIKFVEKSNSTEIILNRADKRNAFHPQMIDEITQAFSQVSLDESNRAVIVKGEGASFCAGADLGWMKSMADFSESENQDDSNKLFEMFYSIYSCPLPVISVAHGHVMGGATGIVACSDIAISTPKTLFAFSEVRLGLVPAVISPFLTQKLIPSHSSRWMLTGERFNGEQALAAGLVTELVEEGELEGSLQKYLNSFNLSGPLAVRHTKRLLRSQLPDPQQHRLATTKVIAERRVSEEGQAGLRGFLDKAGIPWHVASKDGEK